jgi:hypothetical protein
MPESLADGPDAPRYGISASSRLALRRFGDGRNPRAPGRQELGPELGARIKRRTRRMGGPSSNGELQLLGADRSIRVAREDQARLDLKSERCVPGLSIPRGLHPRGGLPLLGVQVVQPVERAKVRRSRPCTAKNANKKNAYGKCVSQTAKAKANKREDAEDEAESKAATAACKKEQSDNAAKFAQDYKNFGQCVKDKKD